MKKTYEELLHDNIELKKKLSYYEEIMRSNGLLPQEKVKKSTLTKSEKISLFMDYFKGRPECYAIRWERNGKSGYSPVYKDAYRYLTIQERKNIDINELFESWSSHTIEDHLRGNIIMGLYPMLYDETTYFLAIDFDEKSWQKDALAFYHQCQAYHLDALIEISRSGEGAHVWLFFESPIKAHVARKLGRIILTETMLERHSLSLQSYDRMFPSQDYLIKGHLGNLIALPLQGKSGQGRTLFVNEELVPYVDQYEALSKIRKIDEEAAMWIVENAKNIADIGPLSSEVVDMEIPSSNNSTIVQIHVGKEISISLLGLHPKTKQFFMRVSSFRNPTFYKNQRMRLSTFQIPRIIELFHEEEEFLFLPKGMLEILTKELTIKKIKYQVSDEQILVDVLGLSFHGQLRSDQQNVLRSILTNNHGIIVAPTGFGKTVLGIALMVELNQRTLIITHRVNLLQQWIDQLKSLTHLNVIDIIDSKHPPKDNLIDIATFQSLEKMVNLSDYSKHYGCIIIDEVHHVAAFTYERLIRQFYAKYIYGFTATPKRSDGLEKITYYTVGEIIAEVPLTPLAMKRILVPRWTSFRSTPNQGIHEITSQLSHDSNRNKLICKDIVEVYGQKKNVLILTERIEHVIELEKELKPLIPSLFVIHGKLTSKYKKQFNQMINEYEGEQLVILATGKLIGEGFDNSRLDTLFLTMPFRWRGTLSQYVGRLSRQNINKSEITVFDYVDIRVRMFSIMFFERQKGYRLMYFEIYDQISQLSSVFDEATFSSVLKEDLNHAKKSIHFIIHESSEKRMVELQSWSSITPIIKDKISLFENEIKEKVNIVIIDKAIVWYGSINPFRNYHTADGTILRIDDVMLANQLLEG